MRKICENRKLKLIIYVYWVKLIKDKINILCFNCEGRILEKWNVLDFFIENVCEILVKNFLLWLIKNVIFVCKWKCWCWGWRVNKY